MYHIGHFVPGAPAILWGLIIYHIALGRWGLVRLLFNAEVELVVVIYHVDEAGRLRVSGEVYRLSVSVKCIG